MPWWKRRNPVVRDDQMTVADAAAELGVSAQSVYRWIKAGELKADPDPDTGVLLISERDLFKFRDQYLEEIDGDDGEE